MLQILFKTFSSWRMFNEVQRDTTSDYAMLLTL